MIVPIATRYSPIGVDIGAHAVKAMQLKRHGHGWQIAAAAHYTREQRDAIDEPAVAQLTQVLQRRGFRGRRLVVATPRSIVKTSLLELPATDGGVSLAQLNRMEMSRVHHMTPQSFALAHWPVPPSNAPKKTTTVMAHACPHELADPLLDLFEQCDLDVESLDVTACALARGCSTKFEADANAALIVDLGWSCCRIIAMRGRLVAYERTVDDAGLATVHAEISKRLGGDDEAAAYILQKVGFGHDADKSQSRPDIQHVLNAYIKHVVEEARYCVDYLRRQYGESTDVKLLLVGGGADVPGLARRIADKSTMSAEPITPAACAECPPSLIEMCSFASMTGALGLARHGGGH